MFEAHGILNLRNCRCALVSNVVVVVVVSDLI